MTKNKALLKALSNENIGDLKIFETEKIVFEFAKEESKPKVSYEVEKNTENIMEILNDFVAKKNIINFELRDAKNEFIVFKEELYTAQKSTIYTALGALASLIALYFIFPSNAFLIANFVLNPVIALIAGKEIISGYKNRSKTERELNSIVKEANEFNEEADKIISSLEKIRNSVVDYELEEKYLKSKYQADYLQEILTKPNVRQKNINYN